MEGITLIKNARAIVTCDGFDNVFYDSDILIQGPQILKIDKDIKDKIDKVIDARNMFIYPGLVNCHHHFFQTFVRNLQSIDFPNMTVPQWLDKIYRIFQIIDDEVIYYSSLTAMADLIKHGCTLAFDHQYCYTRDTGKLPVDRQMEAAKLLGIRYHAGRGTNTLPYSEGSTIPDNMLESTDEFIKDCERLIDKYHDTDKFAMQRIVMAPCQPINSYPETFIETVKLARDKGVRMHTHLGEGENEIMESRWGKRTLEWCQSIDFIGNDVWFAHCWELNPDEYRLLGELGTGITHCPSPAILGGFPILNLKELGNKNVLVSLGCDGSATNDSSNLLDSMRIAWLMQAWHAKERGGCIAPYDMLKIATVNGAKTLGQDDLGSLEPGKGADLFMINVEKLEYSGALHDPKNIIPHVGITGTVDLTMINGNVVYQNGELTNIDECKLAEEGERVCSKVLRDKCNAFNIN